MTVSKHFLLLSLGQLGRVSRPTRMVRVLERHGRLTVLSPKSLCNNWRGPETKHIILPARDRSLRNQFNRAAMLCARRFESEIWDKSLSLAYQSISMLSFDMIFCEDITLLPLAVALRETSVNQGRTKIVMDAREFYPLQFENRVVWKFFLAGLNDYLCRKYLPLADTVFTVSPGLKDAYEKEYGVSCKILPSYSFFHNISPHSTGESIRIIHHGLASAGRKLETMFEIADLLDSRFSVDFMLVPNEPYYYKRLQKLAARTPRVRLLHPVPMPQIVKFISQYDMGLCWFSPATFNLRHCWPNKLFECIQARLALAVAPLPDMAKIVAEKNLGVVASNFNPESFAMRLNSLTAADIDVFKGNAHFAAHDFCWEKCEDFIAAEIG